MNSFKLDIIVQSKYPEILERFRLELIPTVGGKDVRVIELTGEKFGASAINEVVKGEINNKERRPNVIGVLNDDLMFAPRWLGDVERLASQFKVFSPGYIETRSEKKFLEAVAETSEDEGVVPHPYGPISFFNSDIFQHVGFFDERFNWSCDDLDWAWRLHLSGIEAVTARRITVAHLVGKTRERDGKKGWNRIFDANKEKFYDKHGYRSYRTVRDWYNTYHSYFRKFQ